MKSFDLQGHRVFFSESTARPRGSKAVKSQPTGLTTSAASSKQGESVVQGAFVPRAALGRSRPRAGLGHKKNLGLGLSANESEDVDFGDGGTESQQSNVVSKRGGMSQDAFRKMLG